MRKIILRYLPVLFSFVAVQNANAQIEFIQNKGQWDSRVEFRGDFSSGSFFLENQGFTVLIHNTDDLKNLSDQMHGHNPANPTTGQPITLRSHAYKVKFLGASSFSQEQIVPDKIQPYANNYYLGSDQSKWASGCQLSQAVTYKNVYPNIDVRYYSDASKLKYDIIVHPGGNINAIAMQYSLLGAVAAGVIVAGSVAGAAYDGDGAKSNPKDLLTAHPSMLKRKKLFMNI